MRKYGFLAVLALILGLFNISSTLGDETKVFRFKARTWDTISISTEQLNGEYEVALSNGKCEVTQTINGKQYLIVGNAAAELCRMVGIDPDNRMYVKLPLEVGKEWKQTYNYVMVGGTGRTLQKTVYYKVVREIKVTDAEVIGFDIEGSSTIFDRNRRPFEQKWQYLYDPISFYDGRILGVITYFLYDSAVGQTGAKVEIELLK